MDNHPDLILLDIVMPKMGGLSVLKQLRVHQCGSSVPIIVLTNLSSVVVDQEVQDDVSEYLVKDLTEIMTKVKEVLKLR